MRRFGKLGIGVLLLMLGLGLMLSGCAKKPTAELQQAEAALAKAKEAGAAEKASGQYQSAESKLAEAKKLIEQGKYKKAKQLLEEATQTARMSEQAALGGKEGVKPAVSATKTGEATPVTSMAQDMSKSANHVVVKGECLWNISGSKDIYEDPFQWPLIYQANRDQIKNPDRIYPQQDFKISRDAAGDEVKTARKKAGAGAPYWPPGPSDYPKSVRAKYYPNK